jgi:hypothetical protein
MIKPDVLGSDLPQGPWGCRGCDVGDAICAAVAGDADALRRLLERGAGTNLPGDEPWATPLAWATRRGHGRIAEILRRAGATA